MRLPPSIGLCAACRHANVVKSARGSMFILCGLAKTDSRFSKYPVLPVFSCAGFEPPPEQSLPPETP